MQGERRSRCALRGLVLATALAAGAADALAQGTIPDQPQIAEIQPPSAPRGATVEVALLGQRLGGCRELICRYSAYPALIRPVERGLKGELLGGDDGQVRVRLSIAGDAPPGLHEIRAVTAQGITPPQYFYVSLYPQAPEQEPNGLPSQANRVPLPVTIAGVVAGGEDVQDCFEFAAKAGETLTFEVEGFKRFAPPQNDQEGIVYLDSFLLLRDASGRELACSDDVTRLDARLTHTFAQDGTYTITIRDNQYRGRGDFHYRLTIGRQPVITAIFPPGAQKGSRLAATIYGHNLDSSGATVTRRSIELSEGGIQEFRIVNELGASNAIPLVADPYPDVAEAEPNDRAQDATPVILPVSASGKFDTLQDVDAFRFLGQAGQVLVCEVSASRFGSPIDSFLTLRTRAGRFIAADDDGGGMPDARLEAALPESDEYVVFVRNQVKAGAGPQHFYRITLRTRQPWFDISLSKEGINRMGQPVFVGVDAVTIPQGGSADYRVNLARREGQSGDVTIAVNAPPDLQGFRLEKLKREPVPGTQEQRTVPAGPPVIRNGENEALVRITAPPGLAPGTYRNLYLRASGLAGAQPYSVNMPLWVTIAPG